MQKLNAEKIYCNKMSGKDGDTEVDDSKIIDLFSECSELAI